VFTCVTFPFLFGVMFGDVLHGTWLFVMASYLCFAERKPGSTIYAIGHFRYILLLMGLFATFAGFIYNDFTSIPLYTFGKSCYTIEERASGKVVEYDNKCIYPIGVDPTWMMAKNELTYINSLKMKLSVIFGVLQMSMGIIMKGLNAIHFRSKVDFFFEFVPQIVLLLVLFGFMDMMIIIKWLVNWDLKVGAKPPAIITNMITMSLSFGVSTAGETDLIFNQTKIMQMLLIIALITVPMMLFVKPIYLHKVASREDHKEQKLSVVQQFDEEVRYHSINRDSDDVPVHSHHHKHHKKHSFGDIFIHQLIETIEFVLGTISNTASYLRLWALSLAHSQLAKVFFDNTIKKVLQGGLPAVFVSI
jgi:V-type H+-transporting ATPase subunit a